MVVNLARAALAAVLGTILFDLVGFLLTRKFWDIPALLGSKLVADHALLAGLAVHYANGALLGIIYAGLEPSL
jgi:hypothetical protein